MISGGGSVLKKLGKSSILVTDVANQFWCEKQMELNYLFGKKFTKTMAQGKKLHEELQNEIYVPLTIEPVTYEDYLYKTAYENYGSLKSLKANKICREVRIYGSINGYRLSGQIDEMRVVDGKVMVVERKTTDAGRQLNSTYTRPHLIQVGLYRKMLGDIVLKNYTFENFSFSYGLGKKPISDTFKRELVAMGVGPELMDIKEMYRRMFEEIYSIPAVSDRLEVAYMDRASGKQISSLEVEYNESEMSKNMINAMHYWNGDREAAPVVESENWKCKFCKFYGGECKAWWKGG
jgi:exonuclease V